jgi:hypothetical protein
MSDPDKTKAGRVAAEMLRQVKFDIAKFKKVFDGADLVFGSWQPRCSSSPYGSLPNCPTRTTYDGVFEGAVALNPNTERSQCENYMCSTVCRWTATSPMRTTITTGLTKALMTRN